MATGQDLINIAKQHIGERYVFGARASVDNPNWKGPWDCAEFTTWVVYQATKKLYGTTNNAKPSVADAYTGAWWRDSKKLGKRVTVAEAAATPGACLLRRPLSNRVGHIVFCDGRGRTIEAMGTAYGVRTGKINGRVWDTGVLVPWIRYKAGDPTVVAPPSSPVYRLKRPMMHGPKVKEIQRALKGLGFDPGPIDGFYGRMAASAVAAFQSVSGVVSDGQAGPVTMALLGV